ncbi:MAG: hypothetical protein WD342_07180 [Verrucomicrobiales bacterium]
MANNDSTTKETSKKTAPAKKAWRRSVRYSDEQKEEILEFVREHDRKHGRGGQAAAAEKFGTTPLSISKWRKGRGAGKSAVRKRAARKAPAQTAQTAQTAQQTATSTVRGDGEKRVLEQMLVVRGKIEALQAEFDSLKAGL